MDFKSYQKKRPTQQEDKQKASDIRKTVEEYSKKSDDELLSEIIGMAQNGKKNGTFNNESLTRFAQTVSPMLNADQKRRLENVMELLNKN